MARIILNTRIKYGNLSRVKVNKLNSWINLNLEPGGARIKTILNPPDSQKKFLYKVPKYGSFEADTEMFNSILANELGLSHVQYFPAKFPYFDQGVICQSFLNDEKAEELWEMKELICRYSKIPDLSTKMGRHSDVLREHNIDYIYMILEHEFGPSIIPKLFEMIGFDALIGHGDRHWSNYGVIVSGRPVTARFSPIYDTASGYLVEYTEDISKEMLKSQLNEDEWYRPKNLKGLCKITVPNNIKSNHFDLIEHILANSSMNRYKECLYKPFKSYTPKLAKSIINKFFPYLSLVRKNCIEKILERRWEIGKLIFK